MTLGTMVYSIIPAIADLNETHLLNPAWSEHARLHSAWFLAFTAAMAFMSLFILWKRDQLLLPSVVGLSFAGGFWVAVLTAPFYCGALVDKNGIETVVFSLDANVVTFSVLATIFLCALTYALRAEQVTAGRCSDG